MRGRERREERREERHGGGANRYQMREKLVSVGDDYWIENADGQRAFKVDGKALRVRNTLAFEDAHGRELAKIQEKMLRVKDTTVIEGPDGATLATVKKALIDPLRQRYSVKVADGPDLDVQGNLVDHEYKIEQGRETIAEVSKRWFRVRDSYGVEIAPGQNDIVILAITAAIDQMN